MDTSRLKQRGAEMLGFFKSKYLFLIAGAFLLLFIIVGWQRACDRRTEERENEKIRQYDSEVESRLKIFQTYIDLANKDHATTTAILDTMTTMMRNINQLSENDKIIDARVSEISQNEYRTSRTQKNNQSAVANHTAKPNKPLKEREQAALAADALLYPEN